MPTRLILTLACCSISLSAAHAKQLTWSCDAVFDRTGEAHHEDIAVDTEQRTVVKNGSLRWRHGKRIPEYHGQYLQEFVQVEPGRATWGDTYSATPGPESTFSLDFLTGQLTWTDTHGQIMHGHCRSTIATS